ncbi:Cell envelope-associated transcriptional attenuator LytR-CpsA-Psr, subfamily A1 [Pseudonocardia sp. Ae717_Ps2]|uniref:LCP family protein n=1 Tax=Pseudonocardia sp. Ae717_Ps2 TaxID=1885573 RepID=UPI0009670B42|nr:LCP family protein [Pseudonocardia sp. Ae717_Ps2]OLM33499.1 Cell envelope-associated transcriptional attenuator LytR-CpsA-Psr, subfamily A1 [Pseudonocardia sp. Ae717_Ps2]
MGESYRDRSRPSAAERAAARRSGRPTAPDVRSRSPRVRPDTGAARGRPAGSVGWSRAGTGPDEHPPYPARDGRTGGRPPRGRGLLARLRLAVAVLSALTVLLTGAAWTLYRDVTGGITTTNLLFGGSAGGEQNILLVGVDSRTDAQGNPLPADVLAQLRSGAESGVLNSDTIIVVHLPADGGSATAFSIPRDSEVSIPGIGRNKINAAYPQTKAQTASRLVAEGVRDPRQIDQDSSQAGRQALIDTVQDLTGLAIDHFAEVNLLGFYNLTNAVGGVDVCLKAPAKDAFSGADSPAGPQTISGADALAFVRQRHGLAGGDLSRINRQQVFLAAVANKVLSSGTLTDPRKLGALVEVIQQSVVIDSGWDLLGFAREASSIAAGKMDFLTIPTGGPETTGGKDVLLVDPAEVRDFVARHTEPEPEEAAATSTEAAPPVVADVANGSGVTGLAAQVADTLGRNGFTPGEVGNAPDRTTSVVRYSQADGDAAARRVADALGGIGVEQSDAVAQGRVQVLLGTDRANGGRTSAAAAAPAAAPAPSTPPITAGGVPCID